MSWILARFLPDLDRLQERIQLVPGIDVVPSMREGAGYFFRRIGEGVAICVHQPVLLTLALLQWATSIASYYLWVQFLDWIPPDTWSDDSELSAVGLNVGMWVWSLLCLGVATLPIAIFTAALGSFVAMGEESGSPSILQCLSRGVRNLGRLWLLHWVDGVLTTHRILSRLPDGESSPERTAAKLRAEAVYYGWKLGVAGMIPSVLNGRSLANAATESFALLRHRPVEIVWLRASYSACCWVVGVLTYVGTIVLARSVPILAVDVPPPVYSFYCYVGLPIAMAMLVVQVVLRPTYIVAVADLYARFAARERLPRDDRRSSGPLWMAILFVLLVAAIATFAALRTELGIGLR